VSLQPGASERITITFASEDTHLHEATLHGHQSLCYNAPSVSVSLREARIANTPACDHGGGDGAPGAPIEMFIRGAFHPHAAPPPQPLLPLSVSLSANCKPCLLLCDEGTSVQWQVHSTHSKNDAAFFRRWTMCNQQGCPLRFAVRASGPFQVTQAIPSVPQDEIRWKGLTFCSSEETIKENAAETFFLPPNESIEIAAQFMKSAAHIKGAVEDSNHEGKLFIDYANGQVQELLLRATVLHPRIQCKTQYGLDCSTMDFGVVKVGNRLRNVILLQNPTQVGASWTATVEGCDGGWPESAFRICSAREGMLAGTVSHKVSPKHKLEIEFCPSTPGRHDLTVTLIVAGGRKCHFSLAGLATFDEVYEPGRHLTDRS
jgi:hypothetical protein